MQGDKIRIQCNSPGERWWGITYHFPTLICLACLLFKKAVVLSCIRGFLAGVSLTSGSRSSHCQEPPIVCGLDCLPQVSPQPLPASGPDTRFRILVLADHLVYHCFQGLWLATLFFYSILTLWSLPCPTALPCLLVPNLSAYRLVLPTCFCLPSHSLGFIPLLLRTPATSPHTRALPWLPWPVCFLRPVCSACSTFHARFYHVQKNSFPNTCCCFLPGVSYVAANDWAENLTTKTKSNSTWSFFFFPGDFQDFFILPQASLGLSDFTFPKTFAQDEI